jgi:tetratricopeptide (TPR) repeat protein
MKPILLLLCILAVRTVGMADDAVLLKGGNRMVGEMIDYDDRGVRIQLTSGQQVFYPSRDIQSVETSRVEQHDQADIALERREYPQAIVLYRQALGTENRRWATVQIQTGLVRAYRQTGELDEAARLYFEIFAKRSDADIVSLAPIRWMEGQPCSDASIVAARGWLHDERPIARLLAASWLYTTAQRDDARTVLDELQTVEQRIGWMARAQLWRLPKEPPPEDLLKRMQQSVEKIPSNLRAGPQFTLAAAEESGGRLDHAALAYLRVAYIDAPGSDLAAEALLRAARISREIGHEADAQKILIEITRTFPGSVWASDAQKTAKDKPPTPGP